MAVTAAREKLKLRCACKLLASARRHIELKLGAACASVVFDSLNSARILLSLPIISITHFHSHQRLPELLLAALVMLPRAAQRDTHHIGGFTQTQIFIKDQVQRFTLSPGQTLKCVLKVCLDLGSFQRRCGALV